MGNGPCCALRLIGSVQLFSDGDVALINRRPQAHGQALAAGAVKNAIGCVRRVGLSPPRRRGRQASQPVGGRGRVLCGSGNARARQRLRVRVLGAHRRIELPGLGWSGWRLGWYSLPNTS